MRIAIYARVSTEEQARSGFSLGEQLRACRERAAALAPEPPPRPGTGAGAPDVAEFVDDSSGELLERPGLQAALAWVRDRQAGCFVCLDPDRLARRLMHQLLVTDEIERLGCRLEFVQHAYQETAEGRLFYQMRGAIAEFEKAKILERTSRGQRGKIAAGGLPHVIRLYGYRFVKGAGKQALAREALVPDPRESGWVRQVFAWSAEERLTPGEIAARLNQMGVPTKTGRGIWRSTQVQRILGHPVYGTGKLALGKRDHRGIGVARRLSREQRAARGVKLAPRPRPVEQWRYVAVEPLVEHATWQAAQPLRGPRRTGSGGMLSGLGRCGLCGGPLCYLGGSKIACASRYWRKGLTCTLPAKSRKAVEEAVWQAVVPHLLTPPQMPETRQEQPALRLELARCETEVERIGLLFTRGLWPAETALPALEQAQKRAATIRKMVAQQRPVETAPPDVSGRLHALGSSQRREVLRLLVDHYILHPSPRGAPPAISLSPAL